jgi:hypothetical protein
MRHILNSFAFVATSSAVGYFETPSDGYRPFGPGYTIGAYPQDFALVGPSLEAIHDSQKPSTGLAVDSVHNIYLTYPRNSGQTPSNVVICTSFHDEAPWPNASIQNCTASQDPSTCFINVQNVVRDDRGRLWVVDSGIPYNASPDADALFGGAKLMSFNETTAEHLRTYVIPGDLLSYRMNMNDMRVNTTLGGREGYAFITDASRNSSLLAVDLEDGSAVRRLFNTSVVRADEKYVGSFGGELIYTWNGTQKGHLTTAADGIALGMHIEPTYVSVTDISTSIWELLLGCPRLSSFLLYIPGDPRERKQHKRRSSRRSAKSWTMRFGAGRLYC